MKGIVINTKNEVSIEEFAEPLYKTVGKAVGLCGDVYSFGRVDGDGYALCCSLQLQCIEIVALGAGLLETELAVAF